MKTVKNFLPFYCILLISAALCSPLGAQNQVARAPISDTEKKAAEDKAQAIDTQLATFPLTLPAPSLKTEVDKKAEEEKAKKDAAATPAVTAPTPVVPAAIVPAAAVPTIPSATTAAVPAITTPAVATVPTVPVVPTTVVPTAPAIPAVTPTMPTIAPTTVVPTPVVPTTVVPTAPTIPAVTPAMPAAVPTTVVPTTVAPTVTVPAAVAPTAVVPTTIVPTRVTPTTAVESKKAAAAKAAAAPRAPVVPVVPAIPKPSVVPAAAPKPAAPAAPVVPVTARRPQRAKPAAPELGAVIPATIPPKTIPSRQLRRRGAPRRVISMADIPQSPEEKKMIEQALAIVEPGLQEERKKEIEEERHKLERTGAVYLGDYVEPWVGLDGETLEMNFENKELSALLKFLEDNLNITFILDDYIEPNRAEGMQPLAGTKITFKSNVPLTLREAWELGTTFLEMAGFSIIPAPVSRTYRVTLSASKDKPSANREPLPTFIGTDPDLLPDSDLKIRYVYFAENAELTTISQIIEALKSGSAGPLIEFPQLRAVIMTDKSANIKSLVQVLKEIDRVSLPETLAVIRLRHADARAVRELYYRLIGKDPQNPVFNPFARHRKATTTQYFTEATRVFEEPRTNSLIVLGTRENIKRFEDFVIRYVDKSVELPFSPLHIIQLKYIDAASIAKILNDVIQRFNSDPVNAPAAAVGGVRDGNKFFKPTVRITEETSGNRLIINADYEEYLKLRKVIEDLDVEQPQVAIKVLILNVDLTNTKELGVQLRNSIACCDGTGGSATLLGPNVNFQSAQLGPVITRDTFINSMGTPTPVNGAERLLGNLIALASSSPIGSTLVTLGQDMFGFWGLLRALEAITRVSVLANPFLVTTHKYKAEIKIGETRRVRTAIVQGQQPTEATGDLSADLRVIVTPQISYDDMITLSVYVELGQFDPNADTDAGPGRTIRKVSTEAILANREVLALGGLIQDRISEIETGVPLLKDIPLIGWFFKSKQKIVERRSLLILLSPEIVKPLEPEIAQRFTYGKINEAKETLYQMRTRTHKRDPIHRWFFNDHRQQEASTIDKFTSIQQRYVDESHKQVAEVLAQATPTVQEESLLDLVDTQGVAT
jgi:general secretion pathway protein D